MCFLFLNNTHAYTHKTNTYWYIYNTQQMHLSVQSWRIVDYETKILNVIPYISSTSDKIYNITLNCELDLIIFGQILEITVQFQHSTVLIVNALIVHI